MDQSKETIISRIDSTIPAHLFVGSHDVAFKHAIYFMQKQLCSEGGCESCMACQRIKKNQHSKFMCLRPEKSYTRDMLQPLFDQLAFVLDPGHQFFFLVEKADFLTAACANSLLKSVEEPPHGYHFIFIAERLDGVAATIRSRCAIHHVSSAHARYQNHPLFDFFTSSSYHDPIVFNKTVDQSAITERESVELLDALLSYWIDIYRTAHAHGNADQVSESAHIIDIFSQAHKKQPMPGSSKLFWRNLFLSMKRI